MKLPVRTFSRLLGLRGIRVARVGQALICSPRVTNSRVQAARVPTPHTLRSFKVNTSVGFSTFTKLYDCPLSLIPEHSHHQSETPCRSALTPVHRPQPLATVNVLCMDLAVVNPMQREAYRAGFFRLASFSRHHISEVRVCRSTDLAPVPVLAEDVPVYGCSTLAYPFIS